MPKPILVINYCVSGISMENTVRNLKELRSAVERMGVNDDYYVFMLPVMGDSHIQAFYEKDFDETTYEELKASIETKLDELYA
jgi:hypothetical protein